MAAARLPLASAVHGDEPDEVLVSGLLWARERERGLRRGVVGLRAREALARDAAGEKPLRSGPHVTA